ncbi:MAG: DUF1553 domain-containing protein [Victivallales bacterium]|nr:DUF1553 domain-containing protein [Victivallales bacterium]
MRLGYVGIFLMLSAFMRLSASDCYTGGTFVEQNGIDREFVKLWESRGIKPSPLCSDGVFVRRICIDLTGEAPDATLAEKFIKSKKNDKRSILIDRLLKSESFADYWSMKYSDILRVKSEFPVNLWPNAVQAYHRWIRDAVKTNMPYNKFVTALICSSGSNFRYPAVNFYRSAKSHDPKAIAGIAALAFMGQRFELWPEQKRKNLAEFFSTVRFKKSAEWKEEIVYHDATAWTKTRILTFPDGSQVTIEAGTDPRPHLAAWICGKGKKDLASAAVNRTWFWLFGRAIVNEADDMRPENPPVSKVLLNYLADEFIASGYDFKKLCRLIVESSTYQQSPTGNAENPDREKLFAAYPVRRLDAEIICDNLSLITGVQDTYSSVIPEPFTYIPYGQKAVAIADGSITSSFLDSFGRSARDSGYLSERNNKVTAAQRLFLLNSSDLQRDLYRSEKLKKLYTGRSRDEIIDSIYLLVLSRYPSPSEDAVLDKTYPKRGRFNSRDAVSELTWLLINTKEFLFRH